jgi:hypothetical protein
MCSAFLLERCVALGTMMKICARLPDQANPEDHREQLRDELRTRRLHRSLAAVRYRLDPARLRPQSALLVPLGAAAGRPSSRLRHDMRGHGQSANPGSDHKWSAEELLLDMKGFLDALGLEQMHYLGESIGGTLRRACFRQGCSSQSGCHAASPKHCRMRKKPVRRCASEHLSANVPHWRIPS